jgi:hypothetical protein
MLAVASIVGDHVNQIDAPVRPACRGSPGSTVAPNVVACTTPDVPASGAGAANASFAGVTSRRQRNVNVPLAPSKPATATEYAVPAAAANTSRLSPSHASSSN